MFFAKFDWNSGIVVTKNAIQFEQNILKKSTFASLGHIFALG